MKREICLSLLVASTGGTAANLSLHILIQDSTRSVSERVGGWVGGWGDGGCRSFFNVL